MDQKARRKELVEEYRRTGMDWVRDTLAAFGKTRWRRFFHLIR